MLAAVFALAFVFAGCGEGGGDGAATPTGAAAATPAGADEFQVPSLPTVEGPITGPGEMFPDALELQQTPSAADFGYIFEEFFVSGTAAGNAYKVRLWVGRPADLDEFSGHVLVEPKHPIGLPFAWSFTRDYNLPRGHALVELSAAPTDNEKLRSFNLARYGDLQVTDAQESDVFAQVGYLLKSDQTPLPGVKALYFSGHSRSSAPAWRYMDTHHETFRLPDGGPIYDAFFPTTTRTASRFGPFPDVDVPTILINSQLEVETVYAGEGIDYRKPDSDEPGKQFRLYEVAGMPHHDSRYNPLFQGEPCADPLNRYPHRRLISTAFDHLIRWVEDGVPPPRAERISVIGGVGGEVELDEHGNAVGGVRHTYVDVPVATYSTANSGATCDVLGSQFEFSEAKLDDLYPNEGDYVSQVNRRLDQLVREGWLLEEYAEEFRTEAAEFDRIHTEK